MLKKIGISLSVLLLFGVLISCEQQNVAQEPIQEEVEVGNLENDVIIKIDPVNQRVMLSGDEVTELELRFEENEDSEEVYYSQNNDIVQRCLKVQEQLLLVERSDLKSASAKLKELQDSLDSDELWDLCLVEFESFSQE